MIKNSLTEQLRAQADVWRSQLKDFKHSPSRRRQGRADLKTAMAELESQTEEAAQAAGENPVRR